MKKALIVLLLIFTSCILFAQSISDTSKHLTFKGVPLDGTLNQFVQKMILNGFKHINTEDGIAIIQGDFAGYKDCTVSVSTLKQKDLVHNISVIFPDKKTWSLLSENYFNLKQLLTEKYGHPKEIVEKFDTNGAQRDDNAKMYAVQLDRCKFYSIWTSDKGNIQLSVDHKGVSSCFVKLVYSDKINSETIKKQALDDL